MWELVWYHMKVVNIRLKWCACILSEFVDVVHIISQYLPVHLYLSLLSKHLFNQVSMAKSSTSCRLVLKTTYNIVETTSAIVKKDIWVDWVALLFSTCLVQADSVSALAKMAIFIGTVCFSRWHFWWQAETSIVNALWGGETHIFSTLSDTGDT